MHFAKAFTVVTLALGLAGCGGVEGNYLLDKGEMKKTAEAEIAKLPEDQKGAGQIALRMIDGMEIGLELQSGGTMNVNSTTPGMNPGDPSKIEQKQGTWKLVGETLELTIDGKPLKCTNSAGKLTCKSENKDDPVLVFVKG